MKKLFRFTTVREREDGEPPDSFFIRANNVTNAKKEFETIGNGEKRKLSQIDEEVKGGGWKLLSKTDHHKQLRD
jgi:hypothetical protein